LTYKSLPVSSCLPCLPPPNSCARRGRTAFPSTKTCPVISPDAGGAYRIEKSRSKLQPGTILGALCSFFFFFGIALVSSLLATTMLSLASRLLPFLVSVLLAQAYYIDDADGSVTYTCQWVLGIAVNTSTTQALIDPTSCFNSTW
jgi:hypothetical protein